MQQCFVGTGIFLSFVVLATLAKASLTESTEGLKFSSAKSLRSRVFCRRDILGYLAETSISAASRFIDFPP